MYIVQSVLSRVEIKFNRMSITPLNTIIIATVKRWNGTLCKSTQAKTQNAFYPHSKSDPLMLLLLLFVHWNHISCVWVHNKAVKRYFQAPTKMFFFLSFDWKFPFFGVCHFFPARTHDSISPVQFDSRIPRISRKEIFFFFMGEGGQRR